MTNTEGLPLTNSDTEIFSNRAYTFIQVLGEGSFATVWLVNYKLHGEDGNDRDISLACKVVDSRKAPRDFFNKFLPREIDILAKVNHPHLIHLHSIYQRKTKFLIFMRYAEKGDLLDHILAEGEVREVEAKLWARQLSLGLQYLHKIEVVHRDIKCENVLITQNNNVKLADFGFSRYIVDFAGKRYLSSTYCGSLAYAAPELLKGRPYDPKCSDVWSLGVVIYVMLNQCMPFNDKDLKNLYELQMGGKWHFRGKIAAKVSPEITALIRRMLEPDSASRITIDDVVEDNWFSKDVRFGIMSSMEREALQAGERDKNLIIPKSQKLTIPSWKKRKKDEQVVCVTTLRIEQSSKEFKLLIQDSEMNKSVREDSDVQIPRIKPSAVTNISNAEFVDPFSQSQGSICQSVKSKTDYEDDDIADRESIRNIRGGVIGKKVVTDSKIAGKKEFDENKSRMQMNTSQDTEGETANTNLKENDSQIHRKENPQNAANFTTDTKEGQ